ncbi:Pisatin demethylase [Pseudocercospora fuligena]|uniref:Pisatin demethylase n=1 Tax=Pseudocercospora fuligena TaxID=685502 RepID=A0A8H6VEK3_9PEZI|nr:Pisatin demethylase [Pseudocercospora fuligena]
MPSIITYIASAALLCLTYAIYILFFSPDRDIPGPLIARFTALWYTRALLRGDFEEVNHDLHKKYGQAVRLAPGYYSISDPSAIRKIYSGPPNDPDTNYNKSPWYDAWFLPGSRILFNEPSAVIHSQMRRRYGEAYSMSFILSFEHYVDECITVFSQRLKEFYKAGKPVDLAWWFQCFAADAVGMTTYGQRFGYLDEGKDIEGMLGIVHANTSYGAVIGSYHWLHPFLFHIMQFGSELGLIDGNARAAVGRYAATKLEERKRSRSKTRIVKDQLDEFLAYQDQHANSFNDFNILDALCANLVAGSDTTAITLCALIYHVHKDSRILAKLRKELDDADLSSPVTLKQTLSLPYLQATISETLRLHPAVGLPLWRTVPPSGLQVDDILIPAGSNVGGNAWVLHGDSDVFRPERWLEASKEELAAMSQNDFAFGAGNRTCLGKNVSLIEIGKLVPELLRRFGFELVEREWETSSLWFVSPKKFEVRVKKR